MSFIANSCRSRKNMEKLEEKCYNMFEDTDKYVRKPRRR